MRSRWALQVKQNMERAMWEKRRADHIIRTIEPNLGTTPKSEGTIRFVCISDTHGRHAEMGDIPEGDVLVHAGDFSKAGETSVYEGLTQWLKDQPHTHKVVIAGNHDITMQPEFYEKQWRRFHQQKSTEYLQATQAFRESPHFHYLEDSSVTLMGLKIYGTPWQPEFCDWAYNLDRGTPCREMWDKIPADTDVLVSHGPPLGHGDECVSGLRAGCEDLLRTVEKRVRPQLHVFGHIHEGYGVTSNDTTLFVNASTCTFRYRPTNPAIVVDLPVQGQTA